MAKRKARELVCFLALWAVDYQKSHELNGLHPQHYDLMKKYGARMDSFTRATNVPSLRNDIRQLAQQTPGA